MEKIEPELSVGQDEQRRQLRRWAEGGPSSQLAIVTGPAGAGKTTMVRMALEGEKHWRTVINLRTGGRDVMELLIAIDRELERTELKSVIVVIDDVDTLTGSEKQFEEMAWKIAQPPWERYHRLGSRSFPGIVHWVLVGRQLPEDLDLRLRSRKMLGRPLLLHVGGMNRGELAELLQKQIRHPLAKHELAVWTAVIATQLQSNPAAALQLASAIANGQNPYAVLKALQPETMLTLTGDAQGLHVAPTIQFPNVGVEGGNGLITFSPQIYLPKVAAAYREQVSAFEALIRKPRVKENEIQRFLEEHPHFLKGLDYRKLVPHPVLERAGRNKLIPDFFLQPCDGELVDILDLKLPNKVLFTGTVDRLKLSEAVASALAQVREYKDYFENEENKARVLKRYGVTAYRPKVSVVIGLDERVLPEEKRRQIMDAALPAGANVITYRQLAEKMKRHAELVGS